MLTDNNIRDIDIYTARMRKTAFDKLFFVDKMFYPVDTVFDFGCADGTVIRAARCFLPECRFIGYDINAEMLEMAAKEDPSGEYYHDWDGIREFDPGRTILNISSTLHEIYSYGSPASIAQFWHRVWDTGFEYIAIRDMAVTRSAARPADEDDLRIVKNRFPGQFSDYERIWGKVRTQKSLIHFLLKYDYTENWDREVSENYLPLDFEDVMRLIPGSYSVIYEECYALPYLRQKTEHDLGIVLTDSTHYKLLLRLGPDRG